MTRRRPARVLVYHPTEAKDYAALIRAPRGRVAITACATPDEAAGVVAETDIIYGWKFPASLYPGATRLDWLHAMGAGVDWVLVPGFPENVKVTRVPGVFGPWMREYVLARCLAVTQRLDEYRAFQRAGSWREDVIPERLAGKTMVVGGLGFWSHRCARAVMSIETTSVEPCSSPTPEMVPGRKGDFEPRYLTISGGLRIAF